MLPQELENHVVILGWDAFSEMIIQRLVASRRNVVVVAKEPEFVDEIEEEFPGEYVHAVHRELTGFEKFSEFNIEASLRVFVNLDTDDESLIAILNMKKHYKELEYVAVLENDDLEQTFKNAGVSYAVSKFVVASKLVTSYMYESDVALFEDDILRGTQRDEDYDLQQYLISEECKYLNSTYDEAFWEIKNEQNCVCVGMSKANGDGGRELIKNPEGSETLETGDYLLIIVKGEKEPELEKKFGVKEGLQLNG